MKADDLIVTSQSVAGTYTWSRTGEGRIGISDPVPYNASAAESNAALIQACERWEETHEDHS